MLPGIMNAGVLGGGKFDDDLVREPVSRNVAGIIEEMAST